MLSLLPLLGSPTYSPVQSPEYDAARCYRNWPTKNSHCQIAVAICVAESGGHCDATNTAGNTPPSTDRGLWQINDYWHPEVSDTCAYQCSCNGQHALSISGGGTNWSPWATYTGGAYKRHMSEAAAACGVVEKKPRMTEEAFLAKWHDVVTVTTLAEEATAARRLQGTDPFALLMQAIQNIANTWQQIVSAFKSEYSQEIVDKEFSNGWSKYGDCRSNAGRSLTALPTPCRLTEGSAFDPRCTQWSTAASRVRRW